MSEKEMVTRTVTVVLPKKVDDFLQHLAELNGVDLETIFREEIHAVLHNFYDGGYFEKWTDNARDCAQEIQEEFQKEFDC